MKSLINTPTGNSNTHLNRFIQIKPSKRLFVLVSLLHLLAILSLLSASLALIWAQIPIVLLCLHLGFYWHQWRCTPVYLLKSLNEQWHLAPLVDEVNEGTPTKGRLDIIACYYWSYFLVIFIAKDSQCRQHHIPIVYDCCSTKDFRHLKVIGKTMIGSPTLTLPGER